MVQLCVLQVFFMVNFTALQYAVNALLIMISCFLDIRRDESTDSKFSFFEIIRILPSSSFRKKNEMIPLTWKPRRFALWQEKCLNTPKGRPRDSRVFPSSKIWWARIAHKRRKKNSRTVPTTSTRSAAMTFLGTVGCRTLSACRSWPDSVASILWRRTTPEFQGCSML